MHEHDQHHFESRIECGICLQPRLEMVTGRCQHRFCVGCMYDSNKVRRKGMERCPSCQQESAFPVTRPVIPEDLIEIQRALGVRRCERCGEEMWIRSFLDHQRTCVESPLPANSDGNKCKTTPNARKSNSVKKQSQKPRKVFGGKEMRSLLDDFGSGVTTRSSPRLNQKLRGSPSQRPKRLQHARTAKGKQKS